MADSAAVPEGSKFLCSSCGFTEKYDYFGNKPDFVKNFCLMEEAYVMKDPFTDKKDCIILGGHCAICKNTVCVSQNCSLFYTKRFCVECILERIDSFPDEIKHEIKKIRDVD